jgi:hypothetical protein
LAEIISSDVALLVTFNQAIDGVIKNNQKARQNPKALAHTGHKITLSICGPFGSDRRFPLPGSHSSGIRFVQPNFSLCTRFGMERVPKLESLQEIIAEMTESDATSR